MAKSTNRIARTFGIALSVVLPALAQRDPGLTPLQASPITTSAPTPRDQNGDPIPPKPPTAAELETERRASELRAKRQRDDDERERKAVADALRVANEKRAAEQLAEEKKFHNRIMSAIYVGLAFLAVGIGSRFHSRSSR